MPVKPALFAFFSLTCSVVASPIVSGELENVCEDQPVGTPCMLGSLDSIGLGNSLGLGLGGTCKKIAGTMICITLPAVNSCEKKKEGDSCRYLGDSGTCEKETTGTLICDIGLVEPQIEINIA